LGNFFAHSELSGAQPALLREFAVPLSGGRICVEMLRELEAASMRSNQLALAAFWKVQRSVFREQLALARADRDRETR